jgi:hypothetical protein
MPGVSKDGRIEWVQSNAQHEATLAHKKSRRDPHQLSPDLIPGNLCHFAKNLTFFIADLAIVLES